MDKGTFIKDMYSIVDTKNGAALAALMTEDGIFQFANMPPVTGRTEITAFLDQFSFDPETCVFLGRPIDYIAFDDDIITFIEVKTGKSQLSTKQRHIRDLVNSKQVAWKEIRIK